jgi:carbon-monoxide dehydrogenase large subunit
VFIQQEKRLHVSNEITRTDETTYVQIIAEELGIPAEHIQAEEGIPIPRPWFGDICKSQHAYCGAAAAKAARKLRDKQR